MHKKIMFCCTVCYRDSIVQLTEDGLSLLIKRAIEIYSSIDLEKELNSELSAAKDFYEYYAVWHQSVLFDNRIPFLIRYRQQNPIGDVIAALPCDDDKKDEYLENIGSLSFCLCLTLAELQEKMKRLAIANHYMSKVDIFRKQEDFSDFFEKYNGKENAQEEKKAERPQFSQTLLYLFKQDSDTLTKFLTDCQGSNVRFIASKYRSMGNKVIHDTEARIKKDLYNELKSLGLVKVAYKTFASHKF